MAWHGHRSTHIGERKGIEPWRHHGPASTSFQSWEDYFGHLWESKFLLFKATKYVVICYSSHRKWIEILVLGSGVPNTPSVKWYWNWVKSSCWKKFEMDDRESPDCLKHCWRNMDVNSTSSEDSEGNEHDRQKVPIILGNTIRNSTGVGSWH